MSILRSAKFVNYIGNLARNISVSHIRNANGFLPNIRHTFVQPKNYATTVAATKSRNDNTLDRSIRRLDEDARRSGRISRKELEEVIDEIKATKWATSTQSLLVIRCCGNLVPEEMPEFRTKLVTNIWSTLEKLGVPMDISHYNALLRVYLENEHDFSPVEFLSELERKGIEPNRVTYQRLVASYCQKGDIEGATRILEFMREKQMPISEAVFNALILGHAKAGDMESAQGILSVMAQAGLEPSADTYTTLLCGYATSGDAEAIERILAECETKDIFIGDRDYLEIAFTLAINNHDQLVDAVISKVNKTFGYNQDAANVIIRLTTRGKEDIAYKIYQTMVPTIKNNEKISGSGAFFIKQLVKANRPVESILRICEELKENNINTRGLLLATETALNSGNADLALGLIKAMHDNLYPIRNHYFWPILVLKGKKDVLDILKKMTLEFKVYPNSQTLREYVFPLLWNRDSIKNISTLFQELKDCHVSIGSSAANCVAYLLMNNYVKEAASIASSYQAVYNAVVPRRSLSNALIVTNDLESFGKLVHSMVQFKTIPRNEDIEDIEEEAIFDEREYVGRVLLDFVSNRRSTSTPFALILQKFLDLGLGISNSTAEQIQSHLNDSELTTEVSTLLSKLVSSDLTPVPIERKMPLRFVPKNEEALRGQLHVLQAKGESTSNVKRQLFTYYCAMKDIEKAEAYRKELEAENFVLSTGMYAVLIEMYLNSNLLEKAFKTHAELIELVPGIKLDNVKTVKLALGMVQADRLQDAVEFLKNNTLDDGEVDKAKEKDKSFAYSSACWRLLNTTAEKGDVNGVKVLFNVLVENKFIEVSNIFLGPLVKVHIVNDDMKSALDTFEWCCQTHKATPYKNELTCKLIQKEDAVSLQRLTDLSTTVHGEINSLHDLVVSFVECGRVRQARKILETPGLKVRTDRLNNAGERFQTEGLTKPLEALIKTTRDFPQVDHVLLYFHLLKSYVKEDNVEKAKGLWMEMQDEDIQPSEMFLYLLGNYLKEKGEAVPFVLPTSKPQYSQSEISPPHRNLRLALNSNNWETLKNSYEELVKLGGTLSPAETCKLIDKAIDNVGVEKTVKYIQEMLARGDVIPRGKLFYYTKQLAATGNIDVYENYGNFLSDEQRAAVKYDSLCCNCYTTAGKVEKLLDAYENDLKQVESETSKAHAESKIPYGGFIGLLQNHPEIQSRVENLADQYYSKGIITLHNILWCHYVLNNDLESANTVFKKYLQSSPGFSFRYLNNKAKVTKNEELADYVLTTIQSHDHVTSKHINMLYSTKLNIIAEKRDYQKALSLLNEILKTTSIEELSISVLKKVEALADSSTPFPYAIPKKRLSGKEADDDTASSDSEDDVKSSTKSTLPSGQTT